MIAAITRLRCDNLLAQVNDENIATVEAVLTLVVAGQVRQSESLECDAPGPLLTGAHRTDPAGRPGATLTATSAPIPVTARRCNTCGDILLQGACDILLQGACSCTDTVEAARAAELVAHELDFEAETTLAVADKFPREDRIYPVSILWTESDLPDAGMADEIGGGVCSVDLRPGDRVEVVEAVGSKTGPRYAIGRFVGWERNERTGERVQLVEVHGVIGRYGAVQRVG